MGTPAKDGRGDGNDDSTTIQRLQHTRNSTTSTHEELDNDSLRGIQRRGCRYFNIRGSQQLQHTRNSTTSADEGFDVEDFDTWKLPNDLPSAAEAFLYPDILLYSFT